jgi:ABC-type phosphate transport system substrate-binding protein
MSRTSSAPGWGLSAAVAGLLALLLTALLAVGPAPRANAAFDTGKCAGLDTAGRGASFARDAHTWFNQNFKINYCGGTPGFGTLDVAYDAAGSSAGRLVVKVRNDTPRFGMTDEPPSTAEIEQMNKGGSGNPFVIDSDPSNDGVIHVVPAAIGAVAPLVNFPNGCNPELLDDQYRTVPKADILADGTQKALLRVRFPKDKFEEVWAQGAPGVPLLDWDEVFPELVGCSVPIIRVVRKDGSGTTFAFKDYLNRAEPAREWLTTFNPNPNIAWPGAEVGSASAQCPTEPSLVVPGKKPDNEDHLTSGCQNGNGSLVPKLVEVDGSIGYSDISTARGNPTTLAVNPALASAPKTPYWTQLENGSGQFTEPTSSPNGFRTDGPRGSNCESTVFTNNGNPLPGTLGDWGKVSGVDSPVGYGLCTLTYGLVFNDNADVWGNTPQEERKARTVKDYWESILSPGSQLGLKGADYGGLPANMLAIAKTGIASVDWGPGAGPTGGGGGGAAGGGGGGGGGGAAVLPPSNLFSLPKKSISSKTGRATISVKIPGPGKVEMVGTANVLSGKGKKNNKKMIQVGRTVLNASKAGTFNLMLKPSTAAKQQLAKTGQLRVNLKITYTPTGGTAKTTTTAVTLKLNKPKGKKGGRR